MKTLMSTLVALLFVSGSFAQDSKSDKKADTKTAPAHECYWMKDGNLLHCYGDKKEPLQSNVKLKNGTTITAKGEMTAKDGTKTQLQNGECVSLMGSVGDCEVMHSGGNEPHDNIK